MSDSKKPGDISKLVDIDFILDDLNNGGDGQEDDHEMKQPVVPSTELSRKRRADTMKGKEPKRRRFCWDDNLHYKFLENIFLFGVQNISAQKVFDVVKLSLDGVSYEFIDSYLQMLRANITTILQDFAASYKQAIAFQNSYSIDGGASRFSVYPFPPLPTDITSPLVQGTPSSDLAILPPNDLNLPPFTSTPILSQPPPVLSERHSLSLFPSSAPQLPQDFQVSQDPQMGLAPSASSQQPAGNPDNLYSLDGMPQLLDSQMDSQIALHQEVLFQNDFVLKRTNGEQNQTDADAGVRFNVDGIPPPAFSTGDDDFSVNALLSGPTNDFLRNANLLLDHSNTATQNSAQPADNPNIFDFL